MVRDEADLLDRSISSLVGFPHRTYVLDTGSKDASPEVARSHGAVVRHFSWNGRFDQARNASIAGTCEDWLLIMDADDVFPPGEFARLGTLLCSITSHATLRYHFDPGQSPIQASRLLRRDLRPCFDGGIHENLGSWLAGLPDLLKSPVHLDVNLIHCPDPRSRPEKLARNLPLLLREWEEHQDDSPPRRRFFLAAELAMTLHHSGDTRSALQLSGTELKTLGGNGPERLRLLYIHLWLLWQAGDLSSAKAVVEREQELLSSTVVGPLLLGLNALHCGCFGDAADRLTEFRKQLEQAPAEFPLPLAHMGTSLLRLLGYTLMMAGDPRTASHVFLEAERLEPGNPENRLRAEIALSMLPT